jgi:hypothetical protein
MADIFSISINGQDFSDIISHEGYAWSAYKLSPATTGRTLDGVMQKEDISTKRTMTITLQDATPLDRFKSLGQALRIDETGRTPISVTYTDFIQGAVTKEFYCSSLKIGNTYAVGDRVYIQGGGFGLEEY